MATNFPTSLDTLTNPSATDTLDSPPHDEQHADANDAIEALQAKVGVDSSAVTSSLDYRVGQLETGGGMTVSSTAPSSPAEGDMWYDDTSGRTYVYYDDGTSQQWVEFGAPPSGIGKVLQVVSTTKTDTFTTSSGTFVDVTGLSVTITPSDSANKVLLIASVNMSLSGGSFVSRINGGNAATGYLADSATPQQSSAGYGPKTSTQTLEQNMVAQPFLYLDAPATTSSTTYTIQIRGDQAGRTLYVNRSVNDTDATYVRGASTITAFEVSA